MKITNIKVSRNDLQRAKSELADAQRELQKTLDKAESDPVAANNLLQEWWVSCKNNIARYVGSDLCDEVEVQVNSPLPRLPRARSAEQMVFGMLDGSNADRRARWQKKCQRKFQDIEGLFKQAAVELESGKVTELKVLRPSSSIDRVLQVFRNWAASKLIRGVGITMAILVVVASLIITFVRSSAIADFLVQYKQPLGFCITVLFLWLCAFDRKRWQVWLPCAIATSFSMYGNITK